MRLLKLELKRVFMTRSTLILLFAALLLSFLMAWLPTTFSSNSYTDTHGNTVKLTGLASIEYEKKLQAGIAGTVTPQKVRQAVEQYQSCLKKYGVENSYDLPEGVYQAEILPYAPLLHGVKEAFADPDTGIAPSVMEINPQDLEHYYDVLENRIISLMKMEQKNNPEAQQKAVSMFDKVTKPYQLYPGYSTDAMDYQIILAFLIALFATVIAAPVFTSDYQTGADDILRCTKYGKAKFAITKIISALLICGITYSLCMMIYIIVSNSLFGWECTKNSMQMLYSIVNLPDMNLLKLQCFVALSGLLSILAAISLTLFCLQNLEHHRLFINFASVLYFAADPLSCPARGDRRMDLQHSSGRRGRITDQYFVCRH